MLWLKETYGEKADAPMRENHSDKRRIEALLHSVPDGTASSALGKYPASLIMKVAMGIGVGDQLSIEFIDGVIVLKLIRNASQTPIAE
jgi:hypothetical protein